ncbi:protein kinase domain-containing protein [Oxalobacteraceae bacterium A2-2]
MTNAASELTRARIGQLFPLVAERYRLLGQGPIGQPSGFGAVWRARDNWLGREVAIKFSDHDMSDELQLCRDIEGQTVRVFDYFRSDEGWNAYAMELLEMPWVSISHFIDAHKFKRGDIQHYLDCFEIARSLLSGLAQIHGRPYSRTGRYVHADIKPDNLFILLAPKRRHGTVFRMSPPESLVKILDMGISTEHGNILSAYTPAYSSGKMVARPGVDLYAVAVSFIQLLTGVLPDRSTMGHKARIRNCIEEMSSGSIYIDALATEFASNCATACSRPGETVRIHRRYLDDKIFNVQGTDFIALRAITKKSPGGAKKDELAELLFDTFAPSQGWQNRTEQRLDLLKDLVAGLYRKGMLVLRGQRYSPA